MAETKNPGYPYTVFQFKVYVGEKEIGGFSECSGLTMDNDVIEYRTGKDQPWMQKIPGLRKFTNIVLKRGFTQDNYLYEWRSEVIEIKKTGGYRRDGFIELIGEDGNPVLRWKFTNGWPNKLEGPALNAKNNEVAVESMELAVERLEFEVVK